MLPMKYPGGCGRQRRPREATKTVETYTKESIHRTVGYIM